MFGTIITPDHWLHRPREESWALFDCHFDLTDPELGLREYRKSHIPGALYAHLEDHLSGPKGPRRGRHPLPDPQTFAEQLGRWGVGPATQVVCYDNQGGAIAARMWWLLRWLGHQGVAVMDGGLRGWLNAGYETTTEIPLPAPRQFSPKPSMGQVITSEELEGLLGNNGFRILDARSEERFNGEVEPLDPVAGHVPGAINTPFWDNLHPRGSFLSAEELNTYYKELLQEAPPAQAAAMCGSGVTACHTLLAMELAGMPGARLYAGSWSEWVTDPNRPVAVGAETP